MRKLLPIFLLILSPAFSFANRQVGGYISVQHLSDYAYTVTFTDYINTCDSGAIPDTMRMNYGDGTYDVFTQSGKVDTLCNCTEAITYSGTHTYPGPGSYHISVNAGPLIPGITNMKNSSTQNMLLFNALNIYPGAAGQDIASPNIGNNPVCSYGCTSNCYTYNPNATATTNDSIAYRLGTCLTDTGYFVPSSVSVNPVTGELSWCNPDSLGLFNFAINIITYKTFVISGDTIRNPIDTEEVELQATIQSTCPTGINEVKNSERFVIYPNPANGLFNYELQITNYETKELTVFNVLGECVYTKELQANKGQINLGNQPAGIYFYRIQYNSGVLAGSGKLAVQK